MDYIYPTPERLAKHAGGIEAPEVTRTTQRRAYRLTGPVEAMHRDGSISDEQWAAYQRFERDYVKSSAVHGLVAAYGAPRGGNGTPASQMAADILCPEDVRLQASRRLLEAVQAIGHPPTVGILVHLITNDASLYSAGLLFTDYSNRNACIAAAKERVQRGLYDLAVHYGACARARDRPR